MKPSIQSRLAKSLAAAAIGRKLRGVLTFLPILPLLPLFPVSIAFAQGCGGMGGHSGGHSGSRDHAAAEPSVTLVWTNILNSHSGLHRSVSAMSVPDAVFYSGLLRDDFKSLKTSAHSMHPGMEEPLESANNRVKQLTKQIPKYVKAKDQAAAATALNHLDIEIERVVALFPPEALPADVVSEFQASDSLDAGDADKTAASAVPVERAQYVCPMHPEVTATRPGACPKCGMALKRTKD